MNRKVNERQTNSVGGFSLAELLVSLSVTSLVMSGLMVGVVSLGKGFKATELYSKSNSAQIRLIDTMAMDLRRAVAISITTSPDSNPSSTSNTSTRFAYSASTPAENIKTDSRRHVRPDNPALECCKRSQHLSDASDPWLLQKQLHIDCELPPGNHVDEHRSNGLLRQPDRQRGRSCGHRPIPSRLRFQIRLPMLHPPRSGSGYSHRRAGGTHGPGHHREIGRVFRSRFLV